MAREAARVHKEVAPQSPVVVVEKRRQERQQELGGRLHAERLGELRDVAQQRTLHHGRAAVREHDGERVREPLFDLLQQAVEAVLAVGLLESRRLAAARAAARHQQARAGALSERRRAAAAAAATCRATQEVALEHATAGTRQAAEMQCERHTHRLLAIDRQVRHGRQHVVEEQALVRRIARVDASSLEQRRDGIDGTCTNGWRRVVHQEDHVRQQNVHAAVHVGHVRREVQQPQADRARGHERRIANRVAQHAENDGHARQLAPAVAGDQAHELLR